MKLTFLGGVDEVGASCMLAEIAGHKILIDCGIRMHNRTDNVLPLLNKIHEGGGVETVIVTHAHTDHIGALPAFYQFHPSVPMYLTLASQNLLPILLRDSLKIMELKAEEEGVVPLYTPEAVDKTLQTTHPVGFGQTVPICDGDIHITFYPAGHILGAALVAIQSIEGTLLMTGDISVTDQRTLPGMVIPPVKPDVIVIESTYGGRFHTSRVAEENRLIEQVATVVKRDGAILFPAFAIGRAQEVILILLDAVLKKKLPRVPIFVDGMVLGVCETYRSHPELVSRELQQRIDRHGHPFFDNQFVIPIRTPRKRQACVKTRPAIYVASSGMLTGGPSQFYASNLAPDAKSFIAITGYQDEESPGRKLQEVARTGSGSVQIGQRIVTLQCGIGTYGLSAHADTSQLVGCLTGLTKKGAAQPDIILVHGDHDARASLQEAIQETKLEKVHRLKLGESFEFNLPVQKKLPKIEPLKIVRGERTDEESDKKEILAQDLPVLAEALREKEDAKKYYSVQELMLLWGDVEGIRDQKGIQRVVRMLRYRHSPFKSHPKAQYLFRLKPQIEIVSQEDSETASNIDGQELVKLDMNSALDVVDQILPRSSGLYRRGAKQQQGALVLYFDFPEVAEKRFDKELKKIESETGWLVEVYPGARQQAFSEAITTLLPPDTELKKNPSVHLNEKKVAISLLDPACLSPEDAEKISREFQETTGFKLVIEVPQAATTTNAAGQNTTVLTGQQVEINQAYQQIRDRFSELPHQPLKLSQKGDTIELSFITPEVGGRYIDVLSQISEELGWRLSIRPNPNQKLLEDAARAILPSAWGVQKVSIRLGESTVIVSVWEIGDKSERLAKKFSELTGYQLVIEVRK